MAITITANTIKPIIFGVEMSSIINTPFDIFNGPIIK